MIPAGAGCTEEGSIDYDYKSRVVRNWSAGRDSTTNHHPALPALSASLLSATGDHEAIQSWIGARRGSEFTATSYRREAMRLLLWLQYECLGKSLSQMNVDDCGNFMAFLQNITSKWISRVCAKPRNAGVGTIPRSAESQESGASGCDCCVPFYLAAGGALLGC